METVQWPQGDIDSKSKPDSPMELDIAKVFMSGNSQAVRLPKAYRFAADIDTLEVQKVGDSLVLTPKTSQSSAWESRVNAVFDDLAATHDDSDALTDLDQLLDIEDLSPEEREALVFHNDWAVKGWDQ